MTVSPNSSSRSDSMNSRALSGAASLNNQRARTGGLLSVVSTARLVTGILFDVESFHHLGCGRMIGFVSAGHGVDVEAVFVD